MLQKQGISRAQLMDVVMTAQLTSGMRGLECVYRAVGGILRDFQDRATPATFPEGWSADAEAFRCGLDTTTKDLTPADQEMLTGWYRRTIGEVPAWVTMSVRPPPAPAQGHPPQVGGRVPWRVAQAGHAVPDAAATTLNGYADGVREAALLGKAWGMSKEWVVDAVWWTAYYFTGMEVLSGLVRPGRRAGGLGHTEPPLEQRLTRSRHPTITSRHALGDAFDRCGTRAAESRSPVRKETVEAGVQPVESARRSVVLAPFSQGRCLEWPRQGLLPLALLFVPPPARIRT